mmetsp:Transcript_30867/g.71322  ORF Transcript_30867/g.71322 Transcript_30867/m.71322 type:complete len:208 (+) Transcript_30867:375-998(+)
MTTSRWSSTKAGQFHCSWSWRCTDWLEVSMPGWRRRPGAKKKPDHFGTINRKAKDMLPWLLQQRPSPLHANSREQQREVLSGRGACGLCMAKAGCKVASGCSVSNCHRLILRLPSASKPAFRTWTEPRLVLPCVRKRYWNHPGLASFPTFRTSLLGPRVASSALWTTDAQVKACHPFRDKTWRKHAVLSSHSRHSQGRVRAKDLDRG